MESNSTHEGRHGPPELTVTVHAPNTVEPRTFTFLQTERTGDAAATAAAAFGYAAGNPTFAKGEEVLDRNRPLIANGVRDGDELELVDAGGGV